MAFSNPHIAPWVVGERLSAAVMQAITTALPKAVDGIGGGTYNLTAALSLLGQLVTFDSIAVNGDANVGGHVYADTYHATNAVECDDLVAQNEVYAQAALNTDGDLWAGGDGEIVGGLTVGGDGHISGGLQVGSAITSAAGVVAGGAVVAGALGVGTSGPITGASLAVTGTVQGADATFTNNGTFANDVTVGHNANVSGDATVTGGVFAGLPSFIPKRIAFGPNSTSTISAVAYDILFANLGSPVTWTLSTSGAVEGASIVIVNRTPASHSVTISAGSEGSVVAPGEAAWYVYHSGAWRIIKKW